MKNDSNATQQKLKIAIVSITENYSTFPVIGPLIITKAIKENCKNIEVKLIDCTFDNVYQKIEIFKPDIVGFSTFTQSYTQTINFAKKLKTKIPNIICIIGWCHITTLPESLDPIFDFGVIGEGQITVVELIKSIQRKEGIKKVPGLVYFKDKKLIIQKRKEELENINEIFPIDYSLINKNYFKKKFIPEIFKFGISMGIMTSIGCPFNCRFCSIKACWKKVRFREVENVINEIKDLYYNYKVRHIDLLDDLFSVNRPRLIQFRERLKQEGLLNKITFSCQARANTINDDICEILKSLNVKMVTMGFESGSDKVLKYIKKDNSLSLEVNQRAIKTCLRHGLNIYGGVMLGIPGEKLEDLDQTIRFMDFAIKNGVSRIWAQILIPLPSTEIWEIAKARNKIDNQFYQNIPDTYNKENPLLLDQDIPLKEFKKRYKIAKSKGRLFVYKTFYKTLLENPFTAYYFIINSRFYIKRLIKFIKQ